MMDLKELERKRDQLMERNRLMAEKRQLKLEIRDLEREARDNSDSMVSKVSKGLKWFGKGFVNMADNINNGALDKPFKEKRKKK